MSLDPRQRFTETVGDYERYRPSYPAGLLDWLVVVARLMPRSRVVDLGAGTGIASRLLAARGLDVTGIEPNDAMRARAEAAGGGPRYLRGDAEATGLPAGYAELVVAAQAFHWFDVPRTMAELARVLVPGGRAAACWNERASSPFLDAYEALLVAHSEEYRKLVGILDATLAKIRAWPQVRDVDELELTSAQRFDREAFFGRVHSSSYVVHGIADREAFERELAALFDAHVQDGVVDFAYRTVAIAWRLAA